MSIFVNLVCLRKRDHFIHTRIRLDVSIFSQLTPLQAETEEKGATAVLEAMAVSEVISTSSAVVVSIYLEASRYSVVVPGAEVSAEMELAEVMVLQSKRNSETTCLPGSARAAR